MAARVLAPYCRLGQDSGYPPSTSNVTGIVYAGAPGEQTGPAIVDVLYGAVNPSGRLPFSIHEDEAVYGTTIVYNNLGFPVVNYTEQLLLDYHYMDAQGITPHSEFGFGLSYTAFTYSALKIVSTGSGATSQVVVTSAVANTGGFAGSEIPQMYLAYPPGAGEPRRVLLTFQYSSRVQGTVASLFWPSLPSY
ncbi:glycoside hydrolase family 3 C-terminal domain-containing protein [Mycena sp. CBHHK59/15]|nr:glycoside hydrolase family 3 C-terminal domain-containing protein [Mycena sp. CBHHK59/15]